MIFNDKIFTMLKIYLLVFVLGWVNVTVAQDYYIYVTAESEDEIALIKFDGIKAETIKTIPIGIWPAEIEGPHGITVGPAGDFWYLSLAHGNPYGTVYKFATGTDEIVGQTKLGMFPASMQISKATGFLYVVNFNLHGDMIPSSVSVVDPETMTELKRIITGVMPHGSRLSPDGMKQYSVGMMSGELFEIDALDLKVTRVLNLDEDHMKVEGKMKMTSSEDKIKMGMNKMMMSKTKPTWVALHPHQNKAYVAANGSNQILEIDLDSWEITHRMQTGKGPYNIDITPDGKKLIVTYKSEGATAIWDLKKRKELAKIANTRKVSHGVAVSPDNKYAFISVEGIGGDPGTMDVIDLKTLKKVASAELGKQAGGIAFWKMID